MIPIYDELNKEVFKTLLSIQIHDNVKARSLDHNRENTYIDTNYDLAVRSQTETYYYIKRMTEQRQKMRAHLITEMIVEEREEMINKSLSKKVIDDVVAPKLAKQSTKPVSKKTPAKKATPVKKVATKKVVTRKTAVKKTAVKKISNKK